MVSGFLESSQGKEHLATAVTGGQGNTGSNAEVRICLDDFADHTRCRLGKWYYEGEGHSCFSRLAGFRELEKPHRAVHRHALEALAQVGFRVARPRLRFGGDAEFIPDGIYAGLDIGIHFDGAAPFAAGFAFPFVGSIEPDFTAKTRHR